MKPLFPSGKLIRSQPEKKHRAIKTNVKTLWFVLIHIQAHGGVPEVPKQLHGAEGCPSCLTALEIQPEY